VKLLLDVLCLHIVITEKLLHIITAARRPLSLKEISLALAIEESYKLYEDIEENLEPKARFRVTVRELCGLFVTIIDAKILEGTIPL
jgi:hypothetical protein